jgi:hypothetical protein
MHLGRLFLLSFLAPKKNEKGWHGLRRFPPALASPGSLQVFTLHFVSGGAALHALKTAPNRVVLFVY